MAITKYRIKKWLKMLFHKSILHVNQPVGKAFSFDKISGYYNDLTEKVTKDKKTIKTNMPPKYPDDTGVEQEFSIGIFQYALGAYDLFLRSNDAVYKRKFFECVDWAIAHQNEDGSFETFNPASSKIAKTPFSAMAQSEAASVFFRAYCLTDDESYVRRAYSSLDFMLQDEKEGGCTRLDGDDLVLMEYPMGSPVLNGWIFSIFGLFDAVTLPEGKSKYSSVLERTLFSLEKHLPNFMSKRWSLYNEAGIIASPFYHRLHVALLEIVRRYTNSSSYGTVIELWKKQLRNPFLRVSAMAKKFKQKAKE